jgi:hypothetical protein
VTSSEKIKVFVDCKNVGCDFNFLRTEIKLVDFVLDRVEADVHILITAVRNGNGGNNLQFIFFGQNKFDQYQDTLLGTLVPNSTGVETRLEIVKRVKHGLVPLISHTSYADFIDIGMKGNNGEGTSITPPASTDKWNYWIFNVGSDGSYNAEQVYKSLHLNGHLSANRTTDKLKVSFNSTYGYNNSTYIYDEGAETKKNVVVNSNYSVNHRLIKSITKHWSAGYDASYSNNTFSNNKRRQYYRAAIEYAIFPYDEVNNKFFTINYGVDVRDNKYYDTTIYNKISETLWGHRAQAYLSLRQKWGSVNSSITYSNFFKDKSLNNLALSININVKVAGNLTFYIYSNGSLIHDQVYLVKGQASEQDILIRRRQIASAYHLNSGAGLNFRLGSMLNNFVNPRFDHP